MTRRPLSFAFFTLVASLFIFSCSLSLNVNGGDNPTPTSVQDNVDVAVEKTLTSLARTSVDEATAATPDSTVIADNVNTLVAQALLTQQPTESLATDTRVPVRPARTAVPATAEISAPPPPPQPTSTPPPTETPLPTNTNAPTQTPLPTSTNTPTQTPTLTETPLPTPTATFTPTQTFTPTRVPTHCAQQYCVIMQRCEPGENTRAVGTIYENDHPKNGVHIRVSYAFGGPPVIPDFISGNDPQNPSSVDPQHPGYYQLGLLEGGALDGNWWVFVVEDNGKVVSEGRLFNTQGQTTATSCQVGITDFYR